MISPELPVDELARVSVLKSLSILDTEPEERFDRVTRMAKRLFNVPIAVVSLVDSERLWFKSCSGLDAVEAPRDASLCSYAISKDEMLVVKDTVKDERFMKSSLVTGEPKVRFYAGCPLYSIAGLKLGTLCLIDKVPRQFSTEEKEVLQDLASMVEQEFSTFHVDSTDYLINATNRDGFLMLAERNPNNVPNNGKHSSLISIELDKFKSINDQVEHCGQDETLIGFTDSLKEIFEDSPLYVQMDKNEFVVMMGDEDKENVRQKVQSLESTVTDYNYKSGGHYEIAFCYSAVDVEPENEKGISQLLIESDLLMYGQKRCNEI